MEPTIEIQVTDEGITQVHQYVAEAILHGVDIVCDVTPRCPKLLLSNLIIIDACSICIYSPELKLLREITPNLTPENYIDTLTIYRALA